MEKGERNAVGGSRNGNAATALSCERATTRRLHLHRNKPTHRRPSGSVWATAAVDDITKSIQKASLDQWLQMLPDGKSQLCGVELLGSSDRG